MDPFSALLMGGLGVGGNLLGNFMANSFNQGNIQQQEAFQEQMSSTAFQRASADMKAAGINPIMAFGHPESAPSGGAAQMQAPQIGDMVTSALGGAVDLANKAKAGVKIDADTKNVEADTVIKGKQAGILDPDVAEAALKSGIINNSKEYGDALRTGMVSRAANLTGIEGLVASVLGRLGFSAKDMVDGSGPQSGVKQRGPMPTLQGDQGYSSPFGVP